ncbi:MAG: FAD-dependent oxidoreductase [Candidatus Micrarchaeota archaeon]
MVQKIQATVVENVQATPTVHLVRISVEASNPFSFKPGQFAMAHVPLPDGKELPRPYSFASSPLEKRFFELCIKRVPQGPGSNYLCDLAPGSPVTVSGPYGMFGLKGNEQDVVFCASGTGIAPFKSMLDLMFGEGTARQVWLLFGIRNQSEIIYDKEFRALAESHKNFHYYPVLSDEDVGDWKGEKGFVPDLIERLFGRDAGDKEFYACGVPIMAEKTREKLLQLGAPKEKVFAELYH